MTSRKKAASSKKTTASRKAPRSRAARPAVRPPARVVRVARPPRIPFAR